MPNATTDERKKIYNSLHRIIRQSKVQSIHHLFFTCTLELTHLPLDTHTHMHQEIIIIGAYLI